MRILPYESTAVKVRKQSQASKLAVFPTFATARPVRFMPVVKFCATDKWEPAQ
jgi:hypothetical protein